MRVALDVRLRLGAADSFVRTSHLQEAGLRAVGVEPLLWKGGALDAELLWVPVTELAPAPSRIPQLLTLHDVNPLRRDGRWAPFRWRRAWRFRRSLCAALRGAYGLAAVSEDAANNAEARFPGRLPTVGVVPHFPDPAFHPPSAEEAAEVLGRLGLAPGFLLYVGALRRHKNWQAVVEAWRALPKELRRAHPLAIVGGHRGRGDALLERLLADAAAGEVHHFQGLSDAELRVLYGRCGLFVFPSYLEGFGLPPLEAMACGAPVLASRTSSLPEVLGDAAAYADPWERGAFTRAVRALLEAPPEQRERMGAASLERAACYSPERTGQAFLDLAAKLKLRS